jgi:hypothetical protein
MLTVIYIYRLQRDAIKNAPRAKKDGAGVEPVSVLAASIMLGDTVSYIPTCD